jgi:predicted CoA-substrate-specific enzyme activase
MIVAGIDAGSRAIKVVLWDTAPNRLLAATLADQGVDQQRLAEATYARALADAGVTRDGVRAVVATGYGRHRVALADTTVTEITCHARGVHHLVPATRTIIEIGGQDSKVIQLEDGGRVRDFAMNDRCAAGTGRFLEMVAGRLGVTLAALGALSRDSVQPAVISNTCAVFAETEIIGLLAEGLRPADIAAGVQAAVATRVAAMMGRQAQPPVCFTGGVALQAGMVRALEAALNLPVTVCPQPQFTGALGAALLAAQRAPATSTTHP